MKKVLSPFECLLPTRTRILSSFSDEQLRKRIFCNFFAEISKEGFVKIPRKVFFHGREDTKKMTPGANPTSF
jgi:hypothetical protein